MADALTEADFNSWRFNRDAVHFNGGKVFFGWGHQCVTQPRLLVIDKYFKTDRSTTRTYQIDGKTTYETLAEALAALGQPVEITADDMAILRTLTPEWSVPEKRLPYVQLARMGLAEWGRDESDRVTCRLTDAGRAALHADT